MYRKAETKVKGNLMITDSFRVKIGVHQRSALCLFLFVLLLDNATKAKIAKAPNAILFADDIVSRYHEKIGKSWKPI